MTAPQQRRTPLRILCVEQDPIQRKLLAASLEVMGADALIVTRALDVVWNFRKQVFDMVLMDIDPHVPNGVMAFEAIRATPVRGNAVPILAVSENECGWSVLNYLDAGFAGLFLKPVEPTRLFRTIEDVMAHWRPPQLAVVQKERRVLRVFGHAQHTVN